MLADFCITICFNQVSAISEVFKPIWNCQTAFMAYANNTPEMSCILLTYFSPEFLCLNLYVKVKLHTFFFIRLSFVSFVYSMNLCLYLVVYVQLFCSELVRISQLISCHVYVSDVSYLWQNQCWCMHVPLAPRYPQTNMIHFLCRLVQ